MPVCVPFSQAVESELVERDLISPGAVASAVPVGDRVPLKVARLGQVSNGLGRPDTPVDAVGGASGGLFLRARTEDVSGIQRLQALMCAFAEI